MATMRVATNAVGVLAVALVGVTLATAGCQRQANEAPATETSAAPAQSGAQAPDITLTTQPDPVTTGENTFEAIVMQDGRPVTDAMVSAEFFMAAMPSMNMPEMRTKAELTHQGNGTYHGIGQIMMAGNWDVTVMVMRDGREIGRTKMTLTAK